MPSPRSQLQVGMQRGDFLSTLGSVFGGAIKVAQVIGSVLPGVGGSKEAAVLSSTAGHQTFPGQVPIKEAGFASAIVPAARAVVGAAGKALAKPGLIKNVGKLLAAGLVFESGGLIFDAITGQLLGRKPRRRMNVLNPRALSRSTRRLAGFQKRASKVEKVLRRLAPPSRRRAIGHQHVGHGVVHQ